MHLPSPSGGASLEVDAHCEDLVTALLVRDLIGLDVVGDMVPGRLAISLEPTEVRDALTPAGWLAWWHSSLADQPSAQPPHHVSRCVADLSKEIAAARKVLPELRGSAELRKLQSVIMQLDLSQGQHRAKVFVLSTVDTSPLVSNRIMLLSVVALRNLESSALRSALTALLG